MKHFKIEEFKCTCCGNVKMDAKFLELLDRARTYAGIPFVITSGYRCEDHNSKIGSTSDNHPLGVAADIRCITGRDRMTIVKALIDAGFRRLGIGNIFIHADSNDLLAAIWIY